MRQICRSSSVRRIFLEEAFSVPTKAYSEGKGDYQTRYDSTKDLYTKKDADGNIILDADGNVVYLTEDGKVDGIEEEVIADLVGVYLFTDHKFVEHLLATDENVFKRVWNEIKYFVKIATTGSSEQKKLLEAQRAFERAYTARGKAQNNTTDNSGVNLSISRTQSMSWEDQVKGALYDGKNIRRNDTLVVGSPSETSVANEISNKPLAIPQSVITKASSGKDISHSIKRGKLAKLDEGIKNAPITIVNPDRNAVVFVTDIKQGCLPVVASFDMDAEFDGDDVHKATSIHLQVDVQSMLENLPESATVYVQKNELDPVGATNNLRGLAAKIKFIDGTLSQDSKNVKRQFSLSDSDGKQLPKNSRSISKTPRCVTKMAIC